jgi:glucosyl-3-phosphoglycerate synthase
VTLARRTHRQYAPELIAEERSVSITVCVPTRDEAESIGPIAATLVELRSRGVVDQVLVADDSTDDTARIADRLGAEVVRQRDLSPHLGPVLGKGDGMWRALEACEGEVICFVDGDTRDFGARIVTGLVGPIVIEGFRFAKATYRRPFLDATVSDAQGGGRVTELTAKPLVRRLVPPLAAFQQPLAGEIAAEAGLLRRLRWATGYSVDIALLIDVWRQVGMEALVEVDLETRQNRHRSLAELGPMAEAVVDAILDRTGQARLTVDRGPWIGSGDFGERNAMWPISPPTATAPSSSAAPSR